ncbi:hypothetical protein [Streptomyces sp. NPDC048172]|uniref:hypothetical protein n=1 Tax=Streptomyces sp. NPDC048172 TaxID=3365505 RepID=UPI00371C5088
MTQRALIAIIETGSGAGGSAYACLPCAREYAKTPLAPEWLPEVIEEAQEAHEAQEGPEDGGGGGVVVRIHP